MSYQEQLEVLHQESIEMELDRQAKEDELEEAAWGHNPYTGERTFYRGNRHLWR